MDDASTTAPRRERRDARANRRRLLDAARAAFAESGPQASVNEIARAAGVGVGTLYRKYPTKGHLVLAILEELHTDLVAEIERRSSPSGAPADDLRGLVVAYLTMLERFGPLDNMLRREGLRAAEHVEPGALRERFVAPLRSILERGVAQGVFRPGLDVDLVARALFGMLDARMLAPRLEHDGVDAVARACTALLLHGIAA